MLTSSIPLNAASPLNEFRESPQGESLTASRRWIEFINKDPDLLKAQQYLSIKPEVFYWPVKRLGATRVKMLAHFVLDYVANGHLLVDKAGNYDPAGQYNRGGKMLRKMMIKSMPMIKKYMTPEFKKRWNID